MRQKTEQELFWEGSFGSDYTSRNRDLSKGREPFWSEILRLTNPLNSACELGANRGENLLALHALNPALSLTGVEINADAVAHLNTMNGVTGVHSPIQDFESDATFDLVYTCGVMIHLNPDDLPAVYDKMARLSSRYVLINEYYNPQPVEISYRGHSGKLFKRDFAGEFLDSQKGMFQIVSYGFLWNRLHPAWDNTTWVLMEKTKTTA